MPALTPLNGAAIQTQVITGAVPGANLLVSASSNHTITVVGYQLSSPVNTATISWRSNTTDLTGQLPITSGSTVSVFPVCGVVSCTRGQNLNLMVSGTTVNGFVQFHKVATNA